MKKLKYLIVSCMYMTYPFYMYKTIILSFFCHEGNKIDMFLFFLSKYLSSIIHWFVCSLNRWKIDLIDEIISRYLICFLNWTKEIDNLMCVKENVDIYDWLHMFKNCCYYYKERYFIWLSQSISHLSNLYFVWIWKNVVSKNKIKKKERMIIMCFYSWCIINE